MKRNLFKKSNIYQNAISLLILALFVVFVIVPLVGVLYKSFLNPTTGKITGENFTRFFSRPYYTTTLFNSFKVTIVTTLISAALGLTMAYLTRQFKVRGTSILNICIIISYLSPPFIGAYAWIQLLGRRGFITKIFATILGKQLPGVYGFGGIVLVFSLQSFPLVYMYVSGALQNIDNSLNEAAESLGASSFQRVVGIIMPLVMPTLLASSLLVFMRVFSDFGTPMLIGEGYRTFPVVLYNQFMGEVSNDSYFAAALCVIVVIITLILFFAQRIIAKKHSYSMTALKPMIKRDLRPGAKVLVYIFVYGVVLLALLPQITVIITSFLKESTPGIYTGEFSLINYKTIFTKNLRVIPNTYLYGISALLIVLLVGVPVAYFAERKPSIITSTTDTITMLPYIIPGSVLGICFLYAFARPPLVLTGTSLIIIISLAIRRMPYTIRSSRAIITQISPSIEEAAVSLGASGTRAFAEVTLPMMMPGIVAGGIMSWVTVISELSSSIMLYRAKTQTLTVSIYTEAIRDCFGNASAYSTILTITSVLSLVLFLKLTGKKEIAV